ncbi:hypothetical protein BCR34DRAFT_628973 [Clohesyomyces aquaticus]|uniref:FAD-binding PCMH-type domain-containing protein n=1 Tax=Clohesyomyces aquaticus TaxID=1231657 RepID=A0A1Y1YCK2_9PLEO|nr:hypothetical protein BCR34DRAFT_628973 [Clohesyomyces aquaticus]
MSVTTLRKVFCIRNLLIRSAAHKKTSYLHNQVTLPLTDQPTIIMIGILLFLFVQAIPAELFPTNARLGNECCCQELLSSLPGLVAHPADTRYNSSLKSYWSTQEQALLPYCIVLPRNSEDVSRVVTVLTASNSTSPCRFAIRGGGHASFSGAANINAGVTIDLQVLNEVTFSANKSVVHIGGGSRWGHVYKTIVPARKAILGGSVGVPGLVTAGGYSYFSARYGFVFDCVSNFEVVLANGTLVSANAVSNAQLYRAHKGGQNNFGIVTRFDMRTFDQGDLWSGTWIHPVSASSSSFMAFENFANSQNNDMDAALISTLTATSKSTWTLSSTMKYAQPIPRPQAFSEFFKLSTIQHSEEIGNLTALTAGEPLGEPGYRWLSATATYANNATMMEAFFKLANQTVQQLPSDPAFSFSLSYQPLTKNMASQGARFGGNSYGLENLEQDHAIYVVNLRWSSAENDNVNDDLIRDLFTASDVAAQSMGLYHPLKYTNYASLWQNPISTYGNQNIKELWDVSKEYDPQQIFQERVPGGFKLPKLPLV